MFDLADFAVSPDGRSLAFVALADSKRPAVWIRAFADADGKVLPGTEGARWVFWSSDSQSIGFTSNHQITRCSTNQRDGELATIRPLTLALQLDTDLESLTTGRPTTPSLAIAWETSSIGRGLALDFGAAFVLNR